MNKYNNTTSVLSVSSKKINHCRDVAQLLFDMNIACKVSENNTVLRNSKDEYSMETGCTVTLTGLDPKHIPKQVWEPLKQRFGLTCAHLHIHGQYQGCLYNYLHKYKCPS